MRIELLRVCFLGGVSGVLSQTTTISSQADATSLAAAYATISGSLEIASSVTGVISFDGIEAITNDFSAVGGTALTNISSSTLQSIGGKIMLSSLALLSTVSFPVLKTIGSLQLKQLAKLSQLDFATQGVSLSSSIVVENTALTRLDGFTSESLLELLVIGNKNLKRVALDVAQVSQGLEITSNNPTLVATFNTLISVNNVTINNVAGVTMPRLEQASSDLYLTSSSLSNFSAPLLERTGGDLRFSFCPSLTSLKFPSLTQLKGTLVIKNNPTLLSIDGFPILNYAWAIQAMGNFTRAVFPALINASASTPSGGHGLKGQNIISTSSTFDCSPFDAAKAAYISGSYTCQGSNTTVTGNTSTNSTESGSTPNSSADSPTTGASSGLNESGKIGLGVGLAVGLIILGTVVFFLYKLHVRKKKKNSFVTRPDSNDNDISRSQPNIAELPLGDHHEKFELASPSNEFALFGTQNSRAELPVGDHSKYSELSTNQMPVELPLHGHDGNSTSHNSTRNISVPSTAKSPIEERNELVSPL